MNQVNYLMLFMFIIHKSVGDYGCGLSANSCNYECFGHCINEGYGSGGCQGRKCMCSWNVINETLQAMQANPNLNPNYSPNNNNNNPNFGSNVNTNQNTNAVPNRNPNSNNNNFNTNPNSNAFNNNNNFNRNNNNPNLNPETNQFPNAIMGRDSYQQWVPNNKNATRYVTPSTFDN